MRDPNRINMILELIKAIWIRNPDWRLGQLLSNFGGFSVGNIFYLEDSEVEKLLKKEYYDG